MSEAVRADLLNLSNVLISHGVCCNAHSSASECLKLVVFFIYTLWFLMRTSPSVLTQRTNQHCGLWVDVWHPSPSLECQPEVSWSPAGLYTWTSERRAPSATLSWSISALTSGCVWVKRGAMWWDKGQGRRGAGINGRNVKISDMEDYPLECVSVSASSICPAAVCTCALPPKKTL